VTRGGSLNRPPGGRKNGRLAAQRTNLEIVPNIGESWRPAIAPGLLLTELCRLAEPERFQFVRLEIIEQFSGNGFR